MDYRTLQTLRRNHPAWRLLTAEHAPLVVSFLYRTFLQPNVRTLAQQELVSRLQDYLFYLSEQSSETLFPKPAVHYLDDWSSDEHGWLRKYYPADSDEPQYDITPATEKAIDWLAGLGRRQFIGTESRLKTVFTLLREMTEGTEMDPAARIAELEKRKAQIDADIQQIREGRISLLDVTQVKDRFLQMADLARGLLSDFRVVEQNFRELDRAVRERIATWEGGKGALLEDILGERDVITESDQGKSFRAFWDFLMSPSRQAEVSELLRAVFLLEAIQELAPDRRLLRIHYDWMAAGEVAQRTVARLSQQLRRYLDDQMWLENRRIMQLIREVEQLALAVRGNLPDGSFVELDEAAPAIDLSIDRPLFRPPFRPSLAEYIVVEGSQDLRADALFEQTYVDKLRLTAHIRRMLQTRSQVSLAEVVEKAPLEHGLAELVAYLSIAADSDTAIIDDRNKQILSWTEESGNMRRATLPLVIFNRPAQRLASMH
jgi:flagellar motility protein MotE (MotC chaperone)